MIDPLDQELHDIISELMIFHTAANKAVLSRHGLRRVRYYTMQVLHAQPGLSLREVSQLTLTDRASCSRMVYSMEKEGLVYRLPNEEDRRQFTLWLTDEGRTRFARASSDLQADIIRRFKSLDPEVKTTLVQLNSHLLDILSVHLQEIQAEQE